MNLVLDYHRGFQVLRCLKLIYVYFDVLRAYKQRVNLCSPKRLGLNVAKQFLSYFAFGLANCFCF